MSSYRIGSGAGYAGDPIDPAQALAEHGRLDALVFDPGQVDIPGLADLGFPLAEVQADGSAVITKLPGTGGQVSRLTCTARLLYEIENPARYLQPDVVADSSGVQLHDAGPDRVQINGASGTARPAQLKATLGYRDGFIGEGQISCAGPGAVARGRLALDAHGKTLSSAILGLDIGNAPAT